MYCSGMLVPSAKRLGRLNLEFFLSIFGNKVFILLLTIGLIVFICSETIGKVDIPIVIIFDKVDKSTVSYFVSVSRKRCTDKIRQYVCQLFWSK